MDEGCCDGCCHHVGKGESGKRFGKHYKESGHGISTLSQDCLLAHQIIADNPKHMSSVDSSHMAACCDDHEEQRHACQLHLHGRVPCDGTAIKPYKENLATIDVEAAFHANEFYMAMDFEQLHTDPCEEQPKIDDIAGLKASRAAADCGSMFSEFKCAVSGCTPPFEQPGVGVCPANPGRVVQGDIICAPTNVAELPDADPLDSHSLLGSAGSAGDGR